MATMQGDMTATTMVTDNEGNDTSLTTNVNDEDCRRDTNQPACDEDNGVSPDLEDESCRHFDCEMYDFCSGLDWEDEECRSDFSHFQGNKGFGLFDIAMLNDFIYRATRYSSKCGAPLNLKVVDKRWGAGIKIQCACVHCQAVLELLNCTWKKSAIVSPTKKRSRMTPEINSRIANGARMNCINMSQIWGLFETMLDTKIMHPRNLRCSEETV